MMKKRHITYIGAALLLAGCTDEENIVSGTLSGEGKTPLQIEATLGNGSGVTRAAGKDFAPGDQLLVYLRHTTEGTLGSYTTTTADQAPRLVTFTMNSGENKPAMSAVDANTNGTSDFTTSYTSNSSTTVTQLYWDDFSNSVSAATDLRTSGHGLQSYYGYCYNGGTPSTALNETTGALGWSVGSVVKDETDPLNPKYSVNQNVADAIQHADLLWSDEQATVIYAHSDARTGTRAGLTIPFTHAMSQITVTVNADEGFTASSNPLNSTTLTLNAMNMVAALTAPTRAFSSTTTGTITMFAEAYNTETAPLTRNYTAIVAPGTRLKVGEILLNITNADGNDYTLAITSTMLTGSQWGATTDANGNTVTVVSGTDDGKTYIETQSGVNYHLTVTVKKTAVETHATLADWRTVNATGTGAIVYPYDEKDEDLVMVDDERITGVTNTNVVVIDKNKFTGSPNASSFSLFTLKSVTDSEDPNYNNAGSSRTNDKYTFATISTFQDNAGEANDQWTNSPAIYWPNQNDNYYFRALAQFNSVNDGVNNISSVGTIDPLNKATTVSQGTVAQGRDILWGTTATHKGTVTNRTYTRGQAIPPRTGDVPIAFEHAMSKVTIQLETVSGTVSANSPAVDLTNAQIAVTNLYTSGTISIEDGDISVTDATDFNSTTTPLTSVAIPQQAAPITDLLVIPQTITNASILTITLADGTTYRLQLNLCKDSSNEAIGAWERGKHYTYTIHLEKELITFRALIKDWEGTTGSGNANLEWD